MEEIYLTQNKVALVDDCDFKWLSRWKWSAHKSRKTFYAWRNSPLVNGKQFTIQMHCKIIGKPPTGCETDHWDGNGLNNQRENLRHVTRRQNSQNKKNIEKSSQYPGVSWYKSTKKWVAKIRINGKAKCFGYFTDELEAFEAYRKAVEANGETVIGII